MPKRVAYGRSPLDERPPERSLVVAEPRHRKPRRGNRGSRLLVNGLAWGVTLLGIWVGLSVTLLRDPPAGTAGQPLTGLVGIVGGPSSGSGIRIAGSPPADLDMSEPETTAAVGPVVEPAPVGDPGQAAALATNAAGPAVIAPVVVATAVAGDDIAFAPFPAQVARADESADEPLAGVIPLPRTRPAFAEIPVPRPRPRHVVEEVAAAPAMTITDAEIERHAPK